MLEKKEKDGHRDEERKHDENAPGTSVSLSI